MNSLYPQIIALLQNHHIAYREFDHDPILNYADAEKMAKQFGWHGVESKNVFLKGDDEKFYLYVTIQGSKVDFKKVKQLTGAKCSIASADDVISVIHCVPGCVAPFGFDQGITILLEPSIFNHTDYLFSPGVTTKTIQLNVQDLKPLFENLPNPFIKIDG